MRLLILNKTITLAAAVLASMASNVVHAYSERDVVKLKSLNACQECDLSEADLSGLNFDGAEFIDTDFVGVNASHSTFSDASFENTEFWNSNLTNTVFKSTNFDRYTAFENSDLSGATIQTTKPLNLFIVNSNLTNAKIINIKKVELGYPPKTFDFKHDCEAQRQVTACDFMADFWASLDENRQPQLIIKNTDFSGSEITGDLTDIDFSVAKLRNSKISSDAHLCRTKFPWGVENRDCAKPKNDWYTKQYELDLVALTFSSQYPEVQAWNEIEKDGTTLEQLFVATVYKPNLEMLIPTFQAAFDKRIAEARQRNDATEKKAAAEKKAADEAKAVTERVKEFLGVAEKQRLAKKAADEAAKTVPPLEVTEKQRLAKKAASVAAKRVTPDDVKTIMQHIAKCWQPPLGAAGNELLTVDLLVKLAEDGQVVTVQIKDKLRYGLDSYFKASAIAAERAVFDCSPLPIPPEKYEQLKLLDISFNPELLSR